MKLLIQLLACILQRTAFSQPGRAIVKVMAMIAGELDYDVLYHQDEGEDEIAFPPVSFLLWIIFLVLMPVLLSNLLVGLAVGDVDRLRKTASENRIELQIDLILSFEELLESLGIRHRFAIKELNTNYPNMPVTHLPQWCNRGASDFELVYPAQHEKGRLAKVRKWIAKLYSKLMITDEYSTSGMKISEAIKPPPESLEKQLQKQRQQLETKLQEHGGRQTDQLKDKLKEQCEQLEEQLEAKLKKHREKQSEQFQEAVRQLSECHKEQAIKIKEQTEQSQQQWQQLESILKEWNDQLEAKLRKQLEAKLKEQSGQLEAMLKELSEKQSAQCQEAVRQLSECHKEQAKKSEEQAKKMEEQTERLVSEFASRMEALENLFTQIATK